MLTFKDLEVGERFTLPKYPEESRRRGPYTKMMAGFPKWHHVGMAKGGYGHNIPDHWEVVRVEGASDGRVLS